MPKSVARCPAYPDCLLDDVGPDPEREGPSEWVWGVCQESGPEGPVEATAVSAESVESADQFSRGISATDASSAVAMGPKAVVFKLGYDDAMELFLRGLGGCGVPGADCAHRPSGWCPIRAAPSVVCATGAAASGSDLARVRRSGLAGRSGLCRWQVAEISATDAEMAFPDSD
jgi:hypothetical protein